MTWITGAKPTGGIKTKVHFRNCRNRPSETDRRYRLRATTNNQSIEGTKSQRVIVTSEHKLLKTGALVLLEIVTLDFEDLPVIQVTLHSFPNVVRKAHTDERVRNLFVPVGLAQFDQTPGDGCGVLEVRSRSNPSHDRGSSRNSPSFHRNQRTDRQLPGSQPAMTFVDRLPQSTFPGA